MRVLLFLLCATLAAAFSASAAAIYSITDLGGFHVGSSAQASDINENGIVVGGDFFSTSTTAFRWDGTLHALPTPAGYSSAGAEAINNAGQILGSATTNGLPRAVLWQNDVPTILPIFGIANNPRDLNAQGDVVGNARLSTSDTRTHAYFLKSGATAAIDLGTLGGQEAIAYGINSERVIVGSAESANRNDRAFRWKDANGNNVSDPGEMVQLSDLGFSSAALSINEQNVVSGSVVRSNFTRQPALWDAADTRIDLATYPGQTDGEVFDVNISFQAVGVSGSAVLWENGTVRRLIDLIPADSGWTNLFLAYAINDSGQIVGWGRRADTGTNDRAFLLTLAPVPEPNSLGLLGAMLLAAGARRVRCRQKC